MVEQKMKNRAAKAEAYLQRVHAYLAQARAWCTERNLTVVDDSTEINEEGIPKYQAPVLRISKDGSRLGEVVSVGSLIIGAQGRIDLIGRYDRHVFLLHLCKGPTTPVRTLIDGEGWYWSEARVRRAKRVDEGLFIDLLTDVSDYEFE